MLSVRQELSLSMEKCTDLLILEKARREIELQFSHLFPRCFKRLFICMMTCFFVFLKEEKQEPPNLKTYNGILKVSSWVISIDQHHLWPEHRRGLVKTGEEDFCNLAPYKMMCLGGASKKLQLEEKETVKGNTHKKARDRYLFWSDFQPNWHFVLRPVLCII